MYRTPELSSNSFTAFAWCDFILSITRTELPFRWGSKSVSKWIGIPPCHICIATTFIKKYKVTYTEPTYKAVQVFPLLGHIGGVPVHWHEETSSCGGILLSEENARLYRCWQANSTFQWSPDMWHPAVSPEVKGYADVLHLTIWASFHGNSSEFRSFLFRSDTSANDRSNRCLQKSSLPVTLRWYPLIAPLRGLAFLCPFFQGRLR